MKKKKRKKSAIDREQRRLKKRSRSKQKEGPAAMAQLIDEVAKEIQNTPRESCKTEISKKRKHSKKRKSSTQTSQERSKSWKRSKSMSKSRKKQKNESPRFNQRKEPSYNNNDLGFSNHYSKRNSKAQTTPDNHYKAQSDAASQPSGAKPMDIFEYEFRHLQAELLTTRSQLYEANFKVSALKTKVQKYEQQVDKLNLKLQRQSDQFEFEINEKNTEIGQFKNEQQKLNENYNHLIRKLKQRDSIMSAKYLELLARMKKMVSGLGKEPRANY